MKKILIALFIMFSFFKTAQASYKQLVYDFSFKSLEGDQEIKLSDYKNKVILITNVASRCGFTNQYEDLQALWDKYKSFDLVVLGVPSNNFRQEPGTNAEIKEFCETNFNITFPMTEKVDVIGDNAHPLFKWAKENHGIGAVPKWNFHKIIINKEGKVDKTFSSITNPSSKSFVKYIEDQIKN